MDYSITRVGRAQINEMVVSQSLPGEKVLFISQKCCKRLSLYRMLRSPIYLGLEISMMSSELWQFSPFTAKSAACLLGAIVMICGAGAALELSQNSKTQLVLVLAAVYIGMLATYVSLYKASNGRWFAITNRRLICTTSSGKKIASSIELTDLESVDILEHEQRKRLILKFSKFPISLTGSPLYLKQFFVSDLESPEQVKLMLGSCVAPQPSLRQLKRPEQ